MKITITRALAELKTLESRYEKAVRDLKLVAVKQGTKLRGDVGHIREEDFIKQVESQNNSVTGIYNRILLIKTEIDKSNSTTKITIGGKEMTIQEALVRKKYISLRTSYLNKMKSLYNDSTRVYNIAEEENKETIERLISGTLLNKDLTEAQKNSARKDAEEYVEKTRSLTMVDPCGISDLIEKVEDDITQFNTNIDYVLSESNSTTYIEIPE